MIESPGCLVLAVVVVMMAAMNCFVGFAYVKAVTKQEFAPSNQAVTVKTIMVDSSEVAE